MKLIVKEYLSSLKERDELDAVLPDLLSQLGLNVYSRPARGTRQDGVDVGAVGSLDGGPERVYLFSIKSGDLSRREWDGESAQSLRPSLNEILDSYIPNRLPVEHRDKDISICVTLGGDVLEPVRPLLTGYISQNTRDRVSFEEWNGDRLATHIQSCFLREDLLPDKSRSLLRKALAMLDEADVSYRHFAALIRALSDVRASSDRQKLIALRQMSICLWILFSWAREAKNTECAYRGAELTLLHAWTIARQYAERDDKLAREVAQSFFGVFQAYSEASAEFMRANVLPYVNKLHAVSVAVQGSSHLDINLRLFDILGRLGLEGIWSYWFSSRESDSTPELRDKHLNETLLLSEAVKSLINNNPTLLLPTKDDQAIDIVIAFSLLSLDGGNHGFISEMMRELIGRARFSYEADGRYPCVVQSYGDLLEHPKRGDDSYKKGATSASIFYPYLALWAALLGDEEVYGNVAEMKKTLLQHCTFQFWYPDEGSEKHMYSNSDVHGAALSNVAVERTQGDFLSQVFGECDRSNQFAEMSAVKCGWWPLLLIACRHYRLPPPLHLFRGLRPDLLTPTQPVDAPVS